MKYVRPEFGPDDVLPPDRRPLVVRRIVRAQFPHLFGAMPNATEAERQERLEHREKAAEQAGQWLVAVLEQLAIEWR